MDNADIHLPTVIIEEKSIFHFATPKKQWKCPLSGPLFLVEPPEEQLAKKPSASIVGTHLALGSIQNSTRSG